MMVTIQHLNRRAAYISKVTEAVGIWGHDPNRLFLFDSVSCTRIPDIPCYLEAKKTISNPEALHSPFEGRHKSIPGPRHLNQAMEDSLIFW